MLSEHFQEIILIGGSGKGNYYYVAPFDCLEKNI